MLPASDSFGVSIAIDGDRAIVGAQNDDDNGSASGSVYIFEFDGTNWNEIAKLTPEFAASTDLFGVSVDIDGNRAVVGATGDDDNGASGSGSAYVFEFDGTSWSQVGKLLASDATANDSFGSGSVHQWRPHCHRCLTRMTTMPLSASGSVYLFDFDGAETWNEVGKLYASDAAAVDFFGASIAMDGDRMLVGAHGEDPSGQSAAGSVYVFEHNGTAWVETDKIVASDGFTADNFGISVALQGDRAVIGAHNDDENGFNSSGSAYIFEYDGANWNEVRKLYASDPAASDNFGRSVALDGGWIFVGSEFDDDNALNSGSVYAFQYDIEDSLPTADFTTDTGLSVAQGRATTLFDSTNDLGADIVSWAWDLDGNLGTTESTSQDHGVHVQHTWRRRCNADGD